MADKTVFHVEESKLREIIEGPIKYDIHIGRHKDAESDQSEERHTTSLIGALTWVGEAELRSFRMAP